MTKIRRSGGGSHSNIKQQLYEYQM